MSFRRRFGLVIASATLAIYAVVGGWLSSRAQQQNDPGAQLRIFESVLQHINDDYVDEPDLSKVRAGALRGLAYGLDPYSTYLTAEQVRDYTAGAQKNQVGIGVEVSQVASYLYVIAPVKGGPASQAGVQAGDIIEYIDNRATRDISLYDARQLLQGAPGSEVKLRILRAGPTRPILLTVKRAAFKTPAVETRIEAGRIGVIKVNSLDEGESADVQRAVQELQRQGIQRILLDLRSVAGGSLQEGVRVANLFIREGALAQTLGRGGKSLQTFNADPKYTITDAPAVVLIDRGTAGAAEIVASAFIEHKRGEVIGEKSFGAGAEQQLFKLKGGDGLLLTVVKWASGNGKPFLGAGNASGVTPQIEVKQATDASDADELSNQDENLPNKPKTQTAPDNNGLSPEANAVKQPTVDLQLKKALEVLREKGAERKAA
jgi:carboxyl-terminal processing protease